VAWLLASLWISMPHALLREDRPEWKLPELHDPFPERTRPQPLPPEDELKLRELKPPPAELR
jgi:hypothetical protein